MPGFLWCTPRDRPGLDQVSPLSTCLKCGAYVGLHDSYCDRHRPRRRGAKLRGGGAGHRAFRTEVLRLAGGQCEAVVEGARCEVRNPAQLEAHHRVAVTQGGSNDPVTNALALCHAHHAMVEGRRPRRVS